MARHCTRKEKSQQGNEWEEQGSPIKVKVLKSEPILRENIKDRLVVTYDREVELLVNGRKFCNAVTEVRMVTLHLLLLLADSIIVLYPFLDSNI